MVGITNGNTPNLEMNFASGQCHLLTADKIILVIGSLGVDRLDSPACHFDRDKTLSTLSHHPPSPAGCVFLGVKNQA